MSDIHSLTVHGAVICTNEPVLKDVGSTKLVSFPGVSKEVIYSKSQNDESIAINSYFEFTAWAGAAERIASDLKVGDTIVILDGTPRVESWTDKESGSKKYKTIIRINKFLICPRN